MLRYIINAICPSDKYSGILTHECDTNLNTKEVSELHLHDL